MSTHNSPHAAPPIVTVLMQACTAGGSEAARRVLRLDATLARERVGDTTALHRAVDHPAIVRLLLEFGADPNLRDEGDNATPLHHAAGRGRLDSVGLLLGAGADVHGSGDRHEADVIGWAARRGNEAVVDLLVERGARHHIFSAMAMGDLDLVQRLVDQDPNCLVRRRSRFEDGHSPLYAAFAPPDGLGWLSGGPDYAMLAHLITLGADVEAVDDKGRSPMALAMLRDDREAMRVLKAAGAREPQPAPVLPGEIAACASAIHRSTPMFFVKDMNATIRWYESIGFTVEGRDEDNGEVMFARLTFGSAELTLSPGGDSRLGDVRLWFFTEHIHDLYELLKRRQLGVAGAVLSGEPDPGPGVQFEEDLYRPFYGGHQFSVIDNNGLTLIFWQPTNP